MRVSVAARVGVGLRCAYCHGDLGCSERRCSSCATRLHEDCWELASVCPTRGCLPRVGIPGAPGASRHHLVEWLATFGAIWAALTWLVPAIAAQLWPGVSWPEPTQAFVALSGFVRSWPGLGCGLFVVIASIVVYVRHRRSPGVRWLFTGLTLFGWLAVVPAGFVSLGLPLIQIGGGRL